MIESCTFYPNGNSLPKDLARFIGFEIFLSNIDLIIEGLLLNEGNVVEGKLCNESSLK